jgi:hypothetical protein
MGTVNLADLIMLCAGYIGTCSLVPAVKRPCMYPLTCSSFILGKHFQSTAVRVWTRPRLYEALFACSLAFLGAFP